ncbi:ABC transporter substrate-binding protein [Lachnoclostridium sp. Marseille-P6806]|uniref:ABC transporter substrate-binding protein n=1 Tax=Lachnoclostridium sp. Marseille-P6806 TaxID=2364793 RepID=UPI0013EF28BF|nr:ABC transporter substrate-binding protein [Lachnoclostridium sp. Marseille-P6806]
MKKRLGHSLVSVVLAAVMAAGLMACGGAAGTAESTQTAGETEGGSAAAESPEAAESGTASADGAIVNIGATSALSTINPLNIDVTFMAQYAQSLMFLPLAALDADANWEEMLAESITTDNNTDFTVTLRDVKWSDGEQVTADDVIWTMLRISSPEVANPSFDFSSFKGFDENGQSPSGAEEIEGIEKIDDRTVVFHAAYPLSLVSFINNICTWIPILPSHVLAEIPAEELSTSSWFNQPTVVDGPYFLDDYDAAHYISYHANKDYSLGAPSIDRLNIRIVGASELLAGLKSGEIDVVLPNIGIIPDSDLASAEALENVNVSYAAPVTNQMTFINTRKLPDARVRQAIVYAIDRETLVSGLLSGHGEVGEGFVSSASPYYDDSIEGFSYDPEKAKALLEEAGWDSSAVLEYYVWSGDDAMVKGSQIVQQYLGAVGIQVNLHTVDLDSLMAVAGTDDADLFTVQYTVTPNDYYIDAQYLVDTPDLSWTGGYFSEEVDAALALTQTATDDGKIRAAYRTLQEKMIEDVPMFSMYFISNAGAVSSRISGCEPTLYGALNHVESWTVIK